MKRVLLLVTVAAAARLVMQLSPMAPYAGLDEAYHVARLAFVAEEGRNPKIVEPSIPPYIVRSLEGERWAPLPEHPLGPADLGPYVLPNYEAQQPSLYYTLAAPLVHLLPRRTQGNELLLWRAFSLVFALITVLATASIGRRVAGERGVIAALLLAFVPTWHTLVLRAGSDALACAAIAVAFAISFSAPQGRRGWIVEGLAWAVALSVKLYSWPASVALLPLWRMQRAPRGRWLTVMGLGALSVAATIADLALRTRNPLGLFAFDKPAAVANAVPIAWGEVVKIFIATTAWTSGQHWNALTPLAMALYLGPILVVIAWVRAQGAGRRAQEQEQKQEQSQVLLPPAPCPLRPDYIVLTAMAAFAVAQLINLAGYLRIARALGESLPRGGKEGWYWYSLAPLLFGVVLALVLRKAPRALVVFLAVWIVGWDVLISEWALFPDWLGATSAAGGDLFFRWGPRQFQTTALAGLMRIVSLAAVLAVISPYFPRPRA